MAAGGIDTIAVIGAGPAGRAFALRCARAGLAVVLEDVMPANLRRAGEEFSQFADVSGRIAYVGTVEDAVRQADLAIDFVPDELESKLEIFSLIDRMAPPRTIVCTPTDALSITDLASCTYRPELCVGLRLGFSQIIRSRFASEHAIASVQKMLINLGYDSSIMPDADEPMLMKNLAADADGPRNGHRVPAIAR